MVSGMGSGSGVQVIDSPLLTQQIEAQRLCIKQLKNENNRLKVGRCHIVSPLLNFFFNQTGYVCVSHLLYKISVFEKSLQAVSALFSLTQNSASVLTVNNCFGIVFQL